MITRGDGVGIEAGVAALRGVRLHAGRASPVGAIREVAVHGDSQAELLEAFARLRSELGETDAPTRLAWFPRGGALQRVDASGLDGPALGELRRRLGDEHGITSTMLIDDGPRRWMIALRWRTGGAWELQELAERAGFVDVEVEPAPVGLRRVLDRRVTAARRETPGEPGWVAIFDGAAPIAAAQLDLRRDTGATRPALRTSTAARDSAGLEELRGIDALADDVARAAGSDLDGGDGPLALHLPDRTYPHFPPHDVRSAERCGVALGAAIGAAGLAGRARPVDVLGPRPELSVDLPRPWAIEEVAEPSGLATSGGELRRLRRGLTLGRRRRGGAER